MPAHFRTETFITGIVATDLHTLNTVLGAAIEEQAVETLNAMRAVWDPKGFCSLYSFVRQAQTFPDVLLRRPPGAGSAEEVLIGIELKGWYMLAKEGEPNLRFSATPCGMRYSGSYRRRPVSVGGRDQRTPPDVHSVYRSSSLCG